MKEIIIRVIEDFESDEAAMKWAHENFAVSCDYEVSVGDYEPANKILSFEIAGAPTKYLVWSVEHNGWWKQDLHGYSSNLSMAGLFSKQEAEWIVEDANKRSFEECMIPRGAIK